MLPDRASLSTEDLLWPITVWLAHAAEVASRGLGVIGPVDPQERVRQVVKLFRTPTPDSLYELWDAWRKQHPDWLLIDTVQVPVYFVFCQMNVRAYIREVARRGRGLQPMFKAWAGLTAGPAKSDAVRLQHLLDTMDLILRSTVRRHLDRTPDTLDNEFPSRNSDADNVALAAAVDKECRIRAWIVELLNRDGPIITDTGHSIEVPKIPALSVLGMEHADGIDAMWRTVAKEMAIKVLAGIAPGTLGLLETALPDAAHAAQRAEHDQAAAKKRGGSGGRKAKRAGTEEHAAQHVSIGEPDEDATLVDLKDDRLNPEQKMETDQEEAEAKKDVNRALRFAIDRWGQSGELMLKALADGRTHKEAAKAAGISAPALTKRLKTLQKLLAR